jgi:hypothetical protein
MFPQSRSDVAKPEPLYGQMAAGSLGRSLAVRPPSQTAGPLWELFLVEHAESRP